LFFAYSLMMRADIDWEVSLNMADNGIGDYFISDIDDEMLEEDEELISAPVVVPGAAQQTQAQPAPQQQAPASPTPQAPQTQTAPAEAPAPAPAPAPTPSPAQVAARPQAAARPPSREERLAASLDDLMLESADIQAAALVSMDGFTMAAALPEGMQEDRVGAMSAAILGLGERAAAELGRGHLTQVFIEGEDGYVVLIAAGTRAVLTALAQSDAKLGLVLYDMKTTADVIAEILG
jgi:predicted regulator of Ras-like GTPase activity (Roadblock/LC7/MglB family)